MPGEKLAAGRGARHEQQFLTQRLPRRRDILTARNCAVLVSDSGLNVRGSEHLKCKVRRRVRCPPPAYRVIESHPWTHALTRFNHTSSIDSHQTRYCHAQHQAESRSLLKCARPRDDGYLQLDATLKYPCLKQDHPDLHFKTSSFLIASQWLLATCHMYTAPSSIVPSLHCGSCNPVHPTHSPGKRALCIVRLLTGARSVGPMQYLSDEDLGRRSANGDSRQAISTLPAGFPQEAFSTRILGLPGMQDWRVRL